MPDPEHPIAERRRALLAGLLFSVFMTLAFPPFGLWGFAFVSISPLVWCAATTKKPWRAAMFAGLGSAPFWAFEHRWLVDVTMAGYPLVVLYLSLYPALFVWIMGRFGQRYPVNRWRALWWLVVPIVWIGLEVLRSRIVFNGYPWYRICLPVTYIGTNASIIGISGVCLTIAAISAIIGTYPSVFKQPSKKRKIIAWRDVNSIAAFHAVIGFLIVPQALSIYTEPRFIPDLKYIRIGIIQTNVPQDNKTGWSYEQKLIDFHRFITLTRTAAIEEEDEWPQDLIVWPETMYPGLALDPVAVEIERAAHLRFPDGTPTTYFYDTLIALQQEIDIPMLVGAIGIDGLRIEISPDGSVKIDQDAIYNSVFLIENGVVSEQRYDKIHLTPFGEVMPYISASDWLEKQLLAFGARGMAFSLESGKTSVAFEIPDIVIDPKSIDRGAARIVTPICFEGTMPNIVRRMVFGRDGERQADLIVQLSNDGWFGQWQGGREQHLQLMQWIAMETRTCVVRAVNTGISTAIGIGGGMMYPDADPIYGSTFAEPQTDGVVRIAASIPNLPPPTIYLGNFIDWSTLAFTALVLIVPMLPPGARRDRSVAVADDAAPTKGNPRHADVDPTADP